MREAVVREKVEAYAGKFLADNNRNEAVTDERLERTFSGCVIPAPKEWYPAIQQRIEEMW